MTGIHPTNVSRAVSALEEKGIFIRVNGGIRIDTDPGRWNIEEEKSISGDTKKVSEETHVIKKVIKKKKEREFCGISE
jgi:hypothetical protein